MVKKLIRACAKRLLNFGKFFMRRYRFRIHLFTGGGRCQLLLRDETIIGDGNRSMRIWFWNFRVRPSGHVLVGRIRLARSEYYFSRIYFELCSKLFSLAMVIFFFEWTIYIRSIRFMRSTTLLEYCACVTDSRLLMIYERVISKPSKF